MGETAEADGAGADGETIPIRQAHRFDPARLSQLVGDKLSRRIRDIRQFQGGQSNPTFLIRTDGDELVLRKQPPGELLPSAHAVDREFRVLSALANTDVPVPRPLLFCDDRAVIGTPFYLMERLRGRIFWSPALPELAREERAGIYAGMADALARLHMADWQGLGLADFGRPGNYFARQIGRWSAQWEKSRTRDNPAIDRLAEWLPAHIPPGDDVSICHGDFRIDNMIFHPTEPRVIGILDWELATLGHPLADLAYATIAYVTPPTVRNGLLGTDLAALGIPDRERFNAMYAERTGRPANVTPFHTAFALFRIAVILEGVLARGKAGNAASAEALSVGDRGLALAERGWAIAQGG